MSALAPTGLTPIKKSRWGPTKLKTTTSQAAKKKRYFKNKSYIRPPSPRQQNQPLISEWTSEPEFPVDHIPRPSTPGRLLDRLMQSQVFTAMIASVTSNGNKGIPGDGDRYGDGDTGATEHLPLINLTMSTNDTSNSSSVSSTSFAVRDTALSPVSPISSTSAWTTDVDALLAALNSPATPVSIFNAKSMPTHTPLSNPTPAQTLAPLTEPPDPSSAYEQCRRLIIPLVLQNAQVYDPKYADAAEGEKLKKEVRALTSDAVCADFVGLARDMQRELDMIAVRAENDVVGDANAVAGVKRPREEEQPEARVNRIRLDHSLSISTTGDANGSSLKSKENVKVSNGNTKTVIVPNAEASTRRPEIVSDSPTTTPPLSLSIPNESSSKAKSKSLQVPLSPSADKALPRAPKAMLQGSPLQMTNSDGSRSRATTIDARGRRSYDDDMDSLTSGRSRPGRSPEGDHRLSRLRSDTSRDSDRDRYVAREDYRELPRGRRVSDYDCVDDFHGSSRRGRSPRDSDRGRLGPGGRDDYKGLPARRRTHDYTYDYDYVDEMNKPGPSRQEDWSRDDWGRGQLHHWEMDRDRDFHDHRNRKNTIDDIDRYNYPHRDVSRDGDRDRTRRGSRSDLGRRSKEPGELDDSPPLSSGGRSDMLSGDHADGQVRGRCLSSSSRRTYPPVSPMRPREPLPAPKPKSRTTTPRPARVEGEIHTQTSICQESQFQAPLISRVPGLWLAKIGLNFLDAVEVDFEVETDVATRCRPGAPAHVSVHLLCLPTASVQGEYNKIERSAPPEAVTHAMWNAKTQWPPKGSLTVELNPGDHLRRSWLPKDLEPNMPLDISAHIRPGTNHIRLIHLADLSGYTFLVHASPTPLPQRIALPKPDPVPTTINQQLVNSEWDKYLRRFTSKSKQPGLFNFNGAAVVVEY